jgi:guanylate kinase
MQRSGIVFVVSGPSGTGKSSICKRVFGEDDNLHFSVSCTTRPPRTSECEGKDYYFMTKDLFGEHIANDDFIEYAEVHGNYYGTLHSEVDRFVEAGEDVLLEIDIQGVSKLQHFVGNKVGNNNFHYIFIAPPSFQELEHRLRSRATESEEIISRRLDTARIELEKWESYDYLVTNTDLENAVKDVQAIIQAERLKCIRITDLC